MTDETMALLGLGAHRGRPRRVPPMEKSADADLLREMIGFAAERLTELEVGGTGISKSERIVLDIGSRTILYSVVPHRLFRKPKTTFRDDAIGLAAVRGDRRAGRCLPRPADRGMMNHEIRARQEKLSFQTLQVIQSGKRLLGK